MGSRYYFNKSPDSLSLEECAFLAGINNSPNSYNPFGEKNNTEKINIRTTAVLDKMLELNYISKEVAIANLNKGLKFSKGNITRDTSSNNYDYHTDAVINEVIKDIANKKGISEEFATTYIEMAGLTIYSTQDTSIQKTLEQEASKGTYYLASQKNTNTRAQAAMVIIDHTNGQVRACIAVLLPAIDKKSITCSSVYKDEKAVFADGTEEGYSPDNYNNYLGNITIRRAVESSQNIPFVKIMEQITPKTSINYMKKLGITSLTEIDNNINLALGGLDKGISPLELAGAYATIANNGKYIEPTFYTKVENRLAKTIIKSKQEKHKAFSKEVAYILQDLLTEPVNGKNGTATYCKIDGISVAAKTGTTNEEYDRWLCGFTPYYTAVTWFGYDLNETINFNKKNPSGLMWSNVMKQIHKNLETDTFDKPPKVETVQVCKHSGLVAEKDCTDSYTEYFLKGTSPTKKCVNHEAIEIDTPITREDGFEQ